jgi:hypothetical protein
MQTDPICVVSAKSENSSDSSSSEECSDKLIEDIYELRYGNIQTDIIPVNVELTLPNIDNITPAQASNIKKNLKEYIKQLNVKIGKYIEPKLQFEIYKSELENTLAWFNEAFKLVYGDNQDKNILINIRRWFLTNCKPKNFNRTIGYYIGKRSMHVHVVTTDYLQNKNLYICSIDGNGFLIKKTEYPEVNDIRSDYIKDYLKPLTKKEIILLFETQSFDTLEEEITKFIHCKCGEIYWADSYDNIDIDDFHFSNLDY